MCHPTVATPYGIDSILLADVPLTNSPGERKGHGPATPSGAHKSRMPCSYDVAVSCVTGELRPAYISKLPRISYCGGG